MKPVLFSQRTRRILLVLFFGLPPLTIILLVIVRIHTQPKEYEQFGAYVDATLKKWNARATVNAEALDNGFWVSRKINSAVALSGEQQTKLREAIENFWNCYRQTNFLGFKEFRLGVPFTVDEAVLETLKFTYPKEYVRPKTKEDEVHLAWEFFNGTNRIVRVDTNSINISVAYLTDRRQGIFKHANEQLTGAAVGYMPEVVITHPTAKEIFAQNGKVLYAAVEQFVIFNSDPDQVCPLFVAFYWADSSQQWMPYEMAKVACRWRSLL